jgi:hypothetical protein
MTKRISIAISIFIFCVFVPVWVLSFFPTPCGYGLCLLVYYPIIFAVGLISGWIYYKFNDKIKLNKGIQVILILSLDISLLIYFYPKGEFFPTTQISEAKRVVAHYGELKPTDIFEATEKRDFLLITALYHKFKLPKETYTVTYCLTDTSGSCDSFFKTFNYFIKDNKVFSDNPSIHFEINLTDNSLTFMDTVQQTSINFKVGYPDFGKYRNEFDNSSSDLSDKGERVTGLVRDIDSLRVVTSEIYRSLSTNSRDCLTVTSTE